MQAGSFTRSLGVRVSVLWILELQKQFEDEYISFSHMGTPYGWNQFSMGVNPPSIVAAARLVASASEAINNIYGISNQMGEGGGRSLLEGLRPGGSAVASGAAAAGPAPPPLEAIPGAALVAAGQVVGASEAVRRQRKRQHFDRFVGSIPRSMQGAELKFLDTGLTNMNTNGTRSACMNVVPQGSDYNQRIGRKITMATFQIHGCFTALNFNQLATDAAGLGVTMRLIVAYDKQSNGTGTVAATDLLLSDTAHAFMNLNNRERFVVLLDEMRSFSSVWRPLSATTGYWSWQPYASDPMFNAYKRIGLDAVYGSTDTPQTGSITSCLYIAGNQAAITAMQGSVNGVARIRFYDN